MTDRGKGTAAELAARLAQDPAHAAAARAAEAERRAWAAELSRAEQPVVADLRDVGVEVTSVWDLVNTADPYPAALPVLLAHLDRDGYPDRVREGLARALAVRPAAPFWPRLRELYLRATGRDEEEGLAVALAASATPEHLDALIALLGENSRGDNRIHFLKTIKRIGKQRGRDVLAGLTEDPMFGKEARRLVGRR